MAEFTLEELQKSQGGASEMLQDGNSLQQIKTEYHTAISVQRPRNLDLIVAALDKEAEYGAADFFYSWTVKDKRTGKSTIVEGCSIGAAMAIAREFGNCAAPVQVNETKEAFIFTASFVDLEKGFTVARVYRQKKTESVGKYSADRWEDMEFQKGQSKAIRNVVLAGVPKWMTSRLLRRSKEAVMAGIGKEGLDAARDKTVKFLAGKGVSKERVESVAGSPVSGWDAETLASIRAMAKQINDGVDSAESLFPEIKVSSEITTKEIKAQCSEEKETKTRKCPDRDGDEVFETYCIGQCKKKEGCPAWTKKD